MLPPPESTGAASFLRKKLRMRMYARLAIAALVLGAVVVGILWKTLSPPLSGQTLDNPVQGSLESDALSTAKRRLLQDYPKSAFTYEQLSNGAVGFYFAGMCYMFVALAVVCDEFFVPALEILTKRLKISDEVGGATFMAAGGSAPELFTSFIGVFLESSVGFGTIVGSAVFNVLFVIGMCSFFTPGTLKLTWWPLARDCSYYALSLGALSLFFGVATPQQIYWHEALILFLMYIGYVILMKYNAVLKLCLIRNCRCCKKKYRNYSVVRVGSSRENATPKSPSRSTASTSSPRKHELPVEHSETVGFRIGLLGVLMGDDSTEDQIQMLVVNRMTGTAAKIFEQLDKDESGTIDKKEFGLLLKQLKQKPTDASITKAFSSLDKSGDGSVSKEEFLEWYAQSEIGISNKVEQAFKKIDTNNSGSLDHKEVCRVLEEMGHGKVTEKQMRDHLGELEQCTLKDFKSWYNTSSYRSSVVESKPQPAAEEVGLQLKWPGGKTKCAALRNRVLFVVLFPIVFLLWLTLPDVRKKKSEKWFLLSFLGSIAWIGIFSYLMVWWATVIGLVVGIPDNIMGLTFLAAGTSVPDLLTSVLVARKGHGDMAVSSSVGSNIFDVLVGLPLPWLCYTLYYSRPVEVVADTLTVSVFILFGMIIAVIFLIMSFGWKLTNGLGVAMVILYVVFVAQDIARYYTT